MGRCQVHRSRPHTPLPKWLGDIFSQLQVYEASLTHLLLRMRDPELDADRV